MRKITTRTLLGLFILISLYFGSNSCTKLELPEGQGTSDSVFVDMRLMDIVSNFKSISVQISEIQVQYSSDQSVKTVFRPLKLITNGNVELQKLSIRDTLLSLTRLNPGSLLQLRIVFADNMKIIPKGLGNSTTNVVLQKKEALITLNQVLVKGCDYTIAINMNTNTSIVNAGAGKYEFNPSMLTAVIKPLTGSISGVVMPVLSNPNIYAIRYETDTLGATLISPDGHFLLRGLLPGSYTISYEPLSGYTTSTKAAVVKAGTVVDIGSVSLD